MWIIKKIIPAPMMKNKIIIEMRIDRNIDPFSNLKPFKHVSKIKISIPYVVYCCASVTYLHTRVNCPFFLRL